MILVTIAIEESRGLPPRPNASGETIAKYFIDNRVSIIATYFTFTIALIFFALWLSALWTMLRRAEGGQGMMSAIVLVGGLMALGAALVEITFWSAAANRADKGISPELARTLFDLGGPFFAAWVGLMILVFGGTVIIFRTGIFPRWVGWVGVVTIPFYLISWPMTPSSAWYWVVIFDLTAFPATVGFLVWQVATSWIMVRRLGEPAVSAAP